MHGGAVTVVDGDAVAGLGWPHLSIDTQRQALIDYCGTVATEFSVKPSAFWVFFDASVIETVPRSKAITIEVVDDRPAAAERALEEIEAADDSVAIWSDVNAISLQAAGATMHSLGDLLDVFLDLGS